MMFVLVLHFVLRAGFNGYDFMLAPFQCATDKKKESFSESREANGKYIIWFEFTIETRFHRYGIYFTPLAWAWNPAFTATPGASGCMLGPLCFLVAEVVNPI